MATHRGNIALALLSTILSLVAVEGLLRVAAPIADPYKLHKRRPILVQTYIRSSFPPRLGMQLSTEDGLPGMDGRPTKFTTNNVGLRGGVLVMPKPRDEVRLFMVGGSTTETLYLDDRHALTQVLQDQLNATGTEKQVRVYGAGKSGAHSADHIEMIAHRLVHLEPDAIIVFLGINDLRAAMHRRDYLMLPPPVTAPDTEYTLKQLVRFTLTEFQLGRRAFSMLKPQHYRDAVQPIPLQSNVRGSVRLRQALPVSASAPRTDIPPYRNNLISVVGIARAHDIELVLMTQATSWNSSIDSTIGSWHWLTGTADSSYREDRLDAAIEEYNDAVRAVAAEFRVPLFDLARVLPKSSEYFYDDVHFNVRGAQTVGRLLAEFLGQYSWVHSARETRENASAR